MPLPHVSLSAAVDAVRDRWSRQPVVGLVLGSGLGCLIDRIETEATFDARELPGMPVSTAIGHRGRLVCGLLAGIPVIAQDGRLHSYEGHAFADCVWPTKLMIRLGVEAVVVTNASGGVNPVFGAGEIMVIDDHINLMWGNPLIGQNDDQTGPRFPDMAEPYDSALSEAFQNAATEAGDRVHRGVYLALAGPNYETASEYTLAQRLGADVVGMSTVPEVLVARHAGVRVLGVSVIANVFRPDADNATSGEAVVAEVGSAAPRVGAYVERVIQTTWGDREAKGTACSASVLTADGRGAVAVVRVLGEGSTIEGVIDQFFLAANGRVLAKQVEGTLCYGRWGSQAAGPPEDVVVCRTDGGCVEVYCHGGPAAVARIAGQLNELGIQTIDWREQELGGRRSLDVECQAALRRASTERAALILLEQADGLLRSEIDELIANAELARDAQQVTMDDSELPAQSLIDRLQQLVDRAEFGVHLATPWRVVLAGRPNAGKSTLLNALLGYSRAIVFDQPGTTRDIVTGETALEGWPFLLSDTAGVRATGDALEEEGIRRTLQSVEDADLVCFVLDGSVPPVSEDHQLLTEMRSTVASDRLLVIANKSDLRNAWGDDLPDDARAVSSISQDGLETLMSDFVSRLVGTPPSRGLPMPVTQRQADCVSRALDAARANDYPAVVFELTVLRDGYRPGEAEA